jgi:hypothetical protein
MKKIWEYSSEAKDFICTKCGTKHTGNTIWFLEGQQGFCKKCGNHE